MAKNILEIKNLTFSFHTYGGVVKSVRDVSFNVREGEILGIVGESGCGKSVTSQCILKLNPEPPGFFEGGSIKYKGEEIITKTDREMRKIRGVEIGFIFQGFNLIPNLTVRENIEVGAYLSDKPLDVDDLLKTLGLYEHRHKLPNQLSGGQQQRTTIGRAIVKNPDILLCDEPTGALDYATSKEILKLIEQVNRKYGNTVVMVTHNNAIEKMADRVVKLHDGRIRENCRNETRMAAEDLEW